MFNKELFAQRLRELRKERGLTSEGLAINVQLTKQAISQFENCANYPHINSLVSLADYFDISLDYLVGRSNDPKRYR